MNLGQMEIWAAILFGILFIGLIIFEAWRKKTHYWLRIVSLLIGLVGILILILQPSYSFNQPKYSVHIDKNCSPCKKNTFPSIRSFLAARIEEKKVDSLILNGLEYQVEDLEMISKFPLRFANDTLPRGVKDLVYPRLVTAGEKISISGITSVPGKLFFIDPGSDTIKLDTDDDGSFSFESRFLAEGRYLGHLNFIPHSEEDTIKHTLPFEIVPGNQMNVLLLESYPNFELTTLKNYWVQKGFGIAERIQISNDRHRQAFYNFDEVNLRLLSESLLEQFDMIILDVQAWNDLLNKEQNTILNLVDKEGLGIVIIPHPNEKSVKKLPTISFGDDVRSGMDSENLEKVRIDYSKVWNPMLFEGREIGYTYNRGAGKILVLGTINTYQQVLEGNKLNFQNLWSTIFTEILTEYKEDFQVIVPEYTFEGKTFDLKLLDYNGGQKFYLDEDTMSLKMDAVPGIEGLYSLKVNTEEGWHSIRNNDLKKWFYVHGGDEFKYSKQENIKKYIKQNFVEVYNDKSTYVARAPWPWWIGFCTLILGLGSLWFIEKL